MSQNDDTPTTESAPSSGAVVGSIFSGLGLFGFTIIFAMFMPYETSQAGDIGNDVANVVSFGFNFLVLFVGGGLSGILCFTGLIVSMTSFKNPVHPLTWVGIGLGIAGMIAGVAIFLWRFGPFAG